MAEVLRYNSDSELARRVLFKYRRKDTDNSCCLIAKPITWADTVTRKTIDQVDAHNRVYEGLWEDEK